MPLTIQNIIANNARGFFSGLTPSAWENLKSISFDGVDEYTNLGRITTQESVSALSISLWIKPTSLSSVGYPFGTNHATQGKNYTTTFTDGAVQWVISTDSDFPLVKTPSGILTLNTWTHLLFVFDGSLTGSLNRAKIYADSVSSATIDDLNAIPATTGATTVNFPLGTRSDFFYFFNGIIDEFALFDYALSQSEVTALYNSGCPNNLMDLAAAKRPEHYYRFDDVTYPTVDDIGETGGNDGTMTNQESTDLVANSPCGGFNNYSLAFDGVDEFTTMGTMSDLDNLTEASCSFWVKRDSATTVTLLGYFTAGTSPHLYCQIDSTGRVYLQMYGTGGLKAAVRTSAIATIIGGWYHIALVYDAALTPVTTALSIFINGTKRVVTDTGTTTGIPTDLGTTSAFKLAEVGSNWFDGGLDEVAVFDYALTSANVTDIYNSRVIIDLSTISGLTNPIHWYRCGDNDTYPTISDVGSNPVNDGTMTNMESGDINESVPL